MSNSSTQGPIRPGWYPDPDGSARLRWWNGVTWTDDVVDQATDEARPDDSAPSGAPVYTVFVWLILALPLVFLVFYAIWATTAFADLFRQISAHPGDTRLVAGVWDTVLPLAGLGCLMSAATWFLAFFDWRALGKAGFRRRFHWAFVLLLATVYLIGRAVVVRQQSGRGFAILWAALIEVVAAVVVAIFIVASVVPAGLVYSGISNGSGGTHSSSASPSPSPSPQGSDTGTVPPKSLAAGANWTGTMTINGIALTFQLDGKDAPQAVSSTISLIQKQFYVGLSCHRLTTSPGFKLLQCGDPNGDGSGGPGYSYGPIENAPTDGVYKTGVVAMARQSDRAYSMGSQFFIVYGDSTIPNDAVGGYTVIGTITNGLETLVSDVADEGTQNGSQDGKPAVPTTIDSVTVVKE